MINWKLFFTALLQVCFVAMNVTFISKGYVILLALTAFGISMFWSSNVRQIAFGGIKDRLTYSIGAMTGTVLGYYLSQLILNLL